MRKKKAPRKIKRKRSLLGRVVLLDASYAIEPHYGVIPIRELRCLAAMRRWIWRMMQS